jgi:hypothetical protein
MVDRTSIENLLKNQAEENIRDQLPPASQTNKYVEYCRAWNTLGVEYYQKKGFQEAIECHDHSLRTFNMMSKDDQEKYKNLKYGAIAAKAMAMYTQNPRKKEEVRMLINNTFLEDPIGTMNNSFFNLAAKMFIRK